MEVIIINPMDVNTRNSLLALGKIDRADLWPKVAEYEAQARTFRFCFGLDELPTEPGMIFVRGPRQYGKSTWLELEMKYSAEEFGKGSAFFLNGDEITAIHDWEKALKRVEWLVAQELFRRQCIRGMQTPETLYYWNSKEHELDFVDQNRNLDEVKLGQTSPFEFSWFTKIFPKKKLLVISQSEFQTENVKGITLEQFLLADGFPHPYPGEVENEDIYNDWGRL